MGGMTGADFAQHAHDIAQRDISRRNQLSDAERDAHSQLLFDEYQKGSVTPGQVQKGIDDLYAHEPEETRLGRFGHFMAKAIKGKQQQAPQVSSSTVPGQSGATLPNMDGSPGSFQTPSTPAFQQLTGPAPKLTHKQDFDSIINSANTPEQLNAALDARQMSMYKAKGQADTAQATAQAKQTFDAQADAIRTYITDPQQQKTALEDLARKHAGIMGSIKNLPGQAGQPYEYPKGSGRFVRNVQQPDGSIGQEAMPDGYQPPAPKQPVPRIGTSGGKNVYATLTPEGWKSTLDGSTLKDFRPLPTYAQTGNFVPVETITPEGPGVGSFNRKTGTTTAPTSGSTTALPAGVAKDLNASLQAAVGARTRLRTMEQNAKDALNDHNQQAELSLVANHIGMTLGAQKGARINQAVWNEAVSSAPWLDKAKAQFDSNGYLSGVTLAPVQIKQMLDLARQQAKNMQDQVQDTAESSGIKMPAPRTASQSKWTAPKDAPPAPKEDNKLLKDGGKVIARSKGGQWVEP